MTGGGGLDREGVDTATGTDAGPHRRGQPHAILTPKDILTRLLEQRARATEDRRSLNREAIWLLAQALELGLRCYARRPIRYCGMGGRLRGTREQTDALIEDIYADRTERRKVAL